MKYTCGVEYQNNGKKPSLPDDVSVIALSKLTGYWLPCFSVGEVNWRHIEKFQIVDERYKPMSLSNEQIQRVEDDAQSEFVTEALEVVMPVLQKAIREAFIAGADWAISQYWELSVKEIDPTLTVARAANEYTIRVTRGN